MATSRSDLAESSGRNDIALYATITIVPVISYLVYKKVVASSTTGNEKCKDSNNYWYDRLHPDLQSLPRMPALNLDSWLKNSLFQLVFTLVPAPSTPPELISKKVPPGVYFCPRDDAYKRNRTPAALLYIHGGGRILGACNGSDNIKFCHLLCKEFNIPVLAASYRLAPKHPYPAALDDLTEAYRWLVQSLQPETRSNGIKQQPVRIAVAGDSAGGGLAAELSQKLLDQCKSSGLPVPAVQLLIYPMLDDRTCINEQYDSLPPHIAWTRTSNKYAWSSYLSRQYKPGDEIIPEYASASRRKDLSNLPPAYIFCGTLDLFQKECKDYSNRLKDHGVDVEYEEVVGGCHAMINLQEDAPCVIEMWQHLVKFGKKYLIS